MSCPPACWLPADIAGCVASATLAQHDIQREVRMRTAVLVPEGTWKHLHLQCCCTEVVAPRPVH